MTAGARAATGSAAITCAPIARDTLGGVDVSAPEAAPHPRRPRLQGRERRRRASRSSRRPGAPMSRARPISSRRCCASTATTTSRPSRCRARQRAAEAGADAGAAPRRAGAAPAGRARPGRSGHLLLHAARAWPSSSAAAATALTLANPISADLDVMRPSILPNLLAAAPQRRARLRRTSRCSRSGRATTTIRPKASRDRGRAAHRRIGPALGRCRPRRSMRSTPRPMRWPRCSRWRAGREPAGDRRCARLVPSRPLRRAAAGATSCWRNSARSIPACWRARHLTGRRSPSRSSSTAMPKPRARTGKAGRCSSSRRSSRSSAISPSSSSDVAGREAGARRARRRQGADHRGPALRRLSRQGRRRARNRSPSRSCCSRARRP